MQPHEVAASYDEIAAVWNSDDFDRSNGIAQHLRALSFATEGHIALDVGCGCSGRFIDLLEEHNYKVEGLDLSSKMLEMAAQRHPHITLHHADICTWAPVKSYDFITAWDSIWHVPLDQQAAVITKLLNALTHRGVLIFTTGGVESSSEIVNAAMGVPMYHSALGIEQTLAVIDAGEGTCRHLEFDQHPEPHVYVIAQRRHQQTES